MKENVEKTVAQNEADHEKQEEFHLNGADFFGTRDSDLGFGPVPSRMPEHIKEALREIYK